MTSARVCLTAIICCGVTTWANSAQAQDGYDASTGVQGQCVSNCGSSGDSGYHTDLTFQDLFRRFLPSNPGSQATAVNDEAVAAQRAGNLDEALRLFRRAHAQDRNDLVIRANLMTVLVHVAWRDWLNRRDAASVSAVERLLDEMDGLRNPNIVTQVSYYGEIVDAGARMRSAIAEWRQSQVRAAQNASALARARDRISDITGNVAADLNRHSSGTSTVDLGFGDPSAGGSTPAIASGEAGMMQIYARNAGWSADEQRRLNDVFQHLDVDLDHVSDEEVTRRRRARSDTWANVRRRAGDADLTAAAAHESGPALYSSGWQSGAFDDCAIFALATAAGVPYGVVAARANELVRAATWRSPEERANPQAEVFARGGGGLVGGEVAMLAEMFGQAEVVSTDRMAATVQEGRPVMVSVHVGGGGQHEIVLSRTFQHNGTTWFEAIDSARDGNQRTFLSLEELVIVAAENGVSYRSDPGTTPALLRAPG